MAARVFKQSRSLLIRDRPLVSPASFTVSSYQQQQRRTVATKHTSNFKPPTSDELNELRERVQEFTSKLYMRMCLPMTVQILS